MQTGQDPMGRLSESLGSAIGGGIGKGIAGRQQKQAQDEQSGILSKAMFGNANPEELAGLTPDNLMKYAEITQKKEEFAQKQQADQAKQLADQKQLEAKEKSKPSIIEAAQLKNMGESALKLPGRISDINAGLDLLNKGMKTGPWRGKWYDSTYGEMFKPEDIQQIEGIGARLLTTSFTTLPRIQAEFDSFKSGQISPKLSPGVLKTNLEAQLKASMLEKKNIERIQALQNEGYSEVEALRQATKESAHLEEEIYSFINDPNGNIQGGQSSKLSDEELDKLIKG